MQAPNAQREGHQVLLELWLLAMLWLLPLLLLLVSLVGQKGASNVQLSDD